jgi:Trk-type K+ transport system membrane component
MKITIYWDRVFGLLAAITVVFIAIICYKIINKSNQFDDQDIGQCDMHEAQKIIDNLVRFLFLILFLILILIILV